MFAAEPAERQAEGLGADQDEEHHGRGQQRAFADIGQDADVQPPAHEGQDEGAERPHGGRFRRGRDTADDGTQHGEDQRQGRQHDLYQLGQQLAPAHGVPFGLGNGRGHVGAEIAEQQQVEGENPGQHQARHHGGGEQGAHGQAQDVGQQDQDQAGRDDLAQGAGGADGAAGQALVVAAPNQGAERQQADGDDRGADDARRRPHQHADDDDGKAHAAAHPSHGMADDVDQVLGHAGFLQHHAHEDEQRQGQQGVIGDDAVNAPRQQAEQAGPEAEIAEQQAGHGERDGDGNADHQKPEEATDHADGEQFHFRHCGAVRSARAAAKVVRAPRAWLIACRPRRPNPKGMKAFRTQRYGRPPGSGEPSRMP